MSELNRGMVHALRTLEADYNTELARCKEPMGKTSEKNNSKGRLGDDLTSSV